MDAETTRRGFLIGGSAATASLLTAGTTKAAQHDHQTKSEHERHANVQEYPRERPGTGGPVGSPSDRGKLVPGLRGVGEPPVPVVVPDLPDKLPWTLKDGIKEFHLHARPTHREFLPGMVFDVWGYNDSMPGPTIEAIEGDRVRIVVHNELPEATTVHWHGLEVPCRMDGVHGLTQAPIRPGETFTYEFDLHQNGTFFYHSHGPMQEGIGMVGLFLIYPRDAHTPVVDHDFALILQEFAILPQATVPNTMSMEFNFFTINGRSGPYVTPLVVRLGSRVRIRFLNFSAIDHHPMHLHGHTFWVTGTEGGRIPESAWIPGNNVLVGVAQVREVEFIANNPGDWMIHCHMFHHMMNHMTSMVGPMAGHSDKGMPAGGDMANGMGMITKGPSLSREHGPHLGRGMGEQTGSERELRNGPTIGALKKDPGYKVPGYPQDMMSMHGIYSEAELKKIRKPLTAGMRRDWYQGIEALMTAIRVLPSDLYEKVIGGKGDIPAGASVPGGGHGEMHGDHANPGGKSEPTKHDHPK